MAGVGIGDLKTSSRQAVDVIDHRSAEVVRALRIHDHGGAVEFQLDVVIPFFIENQPVLQAGTAPALDINAQHLVGVFGITLLQSLYLVGGTFGKGDDGFDWYRFTHANGPNLIDDTRLVKLAHFATGHSVNLALAAAIFFASELRRAGKEAVKRS